MVGTFDKPRFVQFEAALCRPFALRHHRMHPLSRSLSDRCDRAQRHSTVAIDANVCAGCGAMRLGMPDRRGVYSFAGADAR